MDKRLVSVIRLKILACVLLVSGCDGTLTADNQSIDVGRVLVNDLGIATTNFHAVNGQIEFVRIGNIVGPDATMFRVNHAIDALARGASVRMEVRFVPTRIGLANAEYAPRLLAGTASTGSFPLRLSGTGVGYFEWPGTAITGGSPPAGQDFGEVCVSTSKAWTYTVSNNSANPLVVSAFFFPPGSPSITVNAATLTVPAHGTSNLIVTFTPVAAEAYDATLVLRTTPGLQKQVGVWTRGKGKNC
jgi:Abnormal spindle-like microcephaly-assoc'd, ASPM-SPD-2-Hydin